MDAVSRYGTSPGISVSSVERLYPTPRRLHRRPLLHKPLRALRTFLIDAWETRAAASRSRLRQRIGGFRPLSKRIAVYAHYAASGRISPMVELQLAQYAAAGFSIIFVSMCKSLDVADIDRLKGLCHEILLRRSFGRDFGAWQDIIVASGLDFDSLDELLLVNDSVLGPIFPMEPIFETMRGKSGLWGLNDSRQGCNHLQSYLLFANGSAAINAVLGFFRTVQLSLDKERVIRRGELSISAAVARRGVPVYSYCGLSYVERFVADQPDYRYEVAASTGMTSSDLRIIGQGDAVARMAFLRHLICHPVNPTHHFAYVMVREFGFPFIKSELVVSNPARLRLGADWASVVPHDSICSVDMMIEHICLT